LAHQAVKYLLGFFLLLWLVAYRHSDSLPNPGYLHSDLQSEPQQTPTTRAPFTVRVADIEYQIKPLYDYELYGLVVSEHNTDSWWNTVHQAYADFLNIKDICVIWGNNARNGSYQDISFSSGQVTCHFSTRSREAWQAFDWKAFSNNHLLSHDPHIVRLLKSAEVGDQIYVKGYLAEYSHQHGFNFKRGTSITRDDTGDGACETVFVTEARLLRRGNEAWRLLRHGAPLGVLGCVLAWFWLPMRLR
jgi:hypothetical protein